jgi:hypothetical protein
MPLLLAMLAAAGCGSLPTAEKDGRIYHCVARHMKIAPANTFGKLLPLERLEYGEYNVVDLPNIGNSSYCNVLSVPSSAYIRYRVDGRVIEKRISLKELTPQRVLNRTVEFFVDEDVVQVNLVTINKGGSSTSERIY